jgi:uncharacterized protein (DUF1800 family)
MFKRHIFVYVFFSILLCVVLSSFYNTPPHTTASFILPYKKAGLTERQAAAHLLNKFTFGATPLAIDNVVKQGLENWLTAQLDGKIEDTQLNNLLNKFDALSYSNSQALQYFPRGPRVLREAIKEGYINKDSVNKGKKIDTNNIENNEEYKDKLHAFMELKGYRQQKELYRQFISKKILSAAYSNNQLHQVLTQFWFNHFNVSITKNQCAIFIPAYERDVIRPNVVAKFSDLLTATAQSPAMLFYLDNFSSVGENENFTNRQQKVQQILDEKAATAMENDPNSKRAKIAEKLANNKKAQGLNENYAREVMELHTLGVDGGYTQADVTQAARVLTGWTIYPMEDYAQSKAIQRIIDRVGKDKLIEQGFVHNNDFLFTINRHDTKEKKVLGKTFAAGGGYQEGVDLLQMLAHHTSTATFICKKLAVKFVSDNPPASLVNKMATTFLQSDGDIKKVLITMATANEFWDKNALLEKTKSPLELAISAARALDADINAPFMLYQWMTKMGEKLYAYQAPTGFPDKANFWINTGSLLNRMNFGLAIASGKIPGIKVDLAALNNNHEPESTEAALGIYCKLLLPERDVAATIKRLIPLINDPTFQQKVNDAADNNAAQPASSNNEMEPEIMGKTAPLSEEKLSKKMLKKNGKSPKMDIRYSAGDNSMLGQVVGIILGSPAFQKR